ncbi:allantoate deiminase-like [Gossypium hirsutum]|uniref:Allantoate deiminase-like n=1 Tax=Gossypium hirsutum TaxID=3635 RepID=A0ABM3ARZ4_GOSHI|nr:allantoate deiminase-like [Gossypium hirsutum]
MGLVHTDEKYSLFGFFSSSVLLIASLGDFLLIAGILPVIALKISDKSGVTVQDALKGDSIEITEDSLLGLKYDPTPIWGYFDLHIEQEPVLE